MTLAPSNLFPEKKLNGKKKKRKQIGWLNKINQQRKLVVVVLQRQLGMRGTKGDGEKRGCNGYAPFRTERTVLLVSHGVGFHHLRRLPLVTHAANDGNFSAEFSIESFNDHKGVKLIENAKKKMISSNSCWQNAYQHLFAGCSEILAVDEKRSRLAWHLSDCFQRDSGRSPFPHCDPKSSIVVCSRSLDDLAHKIHDSLDSIGSHTKQVVQTANYLEGHIDSVLTHSRIAYEQTTKIALSQTQLKEGQENMKRNLEDGLAMLKDSYNYLGKEIEKLRNEAH
ncbi:hypothetical protein JHK87_046600 [Glycine soja]|nr:hypothetical protein JHK87_046600 [Glycine soja]